MDRTQLLDVIYESAFCPGIWPRALDGLAQTADVRGGVLFVGNATGQSWMSSESIREVYGRYIADGWAQRDPLVPRVLAARHPGFLSGSDVFAPGEEERDEAFAEFKRPHGFGGGAGMVMALPTGEMVGFGMANSGPLKRSAVRRLDELYPHLARSALISARLGVERARAAAEALETIGLPAVLLSPERRVVAANRLSEKLPQIHWRARDRITLTDRAADALLAEALAMDVPRSFALRAGEGGVSWTGHLMPIRGTAHDLFSRCVGVLILTPATLPEAPPVDLLRSLFDFTAAEARVARGLVAGNALPEIAADCGVSHETVRSQLRGALAKAGLHRQTELVALLSGIRPWRATKAD